MSIIGKNVKQAGIETLLANYAPEALAGALVGGGVGALTSKKKRLRNILLGMLGGAGAGVGARYALAGKTIGVANRAADVTGSPLAVRVRYNKGGWKADHLPGAKAGIRAAHEGIDRFEKAKSQVKAKLPKPKKPASSEKKDGQTKSAAPIALIGSALRRAKPVALIGDTISKAKPRASWMDTLKQFASRLRGKGSRYIELMRGGNEKIVGTYRDLLKGYDDRILKALQNGNMTEYTILSRGRAGAQAAAWSGKNGFTRTGINYQGLPDVNAGFRQTIGNKRLADELHKVLAARASTAGAVGSAGIAFAGMRPRSASNYFPQQGYYGQGGIYGSDNPLSM